MRAGKKRLPEVETLGKPGSGWVKVKFPDGSFDIYCSPAEPGYNKFEHLVFEGVAALIRFDREGKPAAGEVLKGDNLSYKGQRLNK